MTVTAVWEPTNDVAPETVTCVAPVGTGYVEGTWRTAGFELARETDVPAGAGPVRYTLNDAELPAVTLDG